MAITYESIANTSLTSSTGTVTFSSIPSTYTDLVIITNSKTVSGTAQTIFRLNGDTGSNYSLLRTGTDSGVVSNNPNNVAFGQLSWWGYMGSTFGQVIVAFINNYANTSAYKTVLSRNSNANYNTGVVLTTWLSSAAINSITITPDASSFDIGSTFSLYGIKAA